MVSKRLWKNFDRLFSFNPPYIFIYDKNKKILKKNPTTFTPMSIFYTIYGCATGFPILINIIYRLQTESMSLNMKPIFVLLFIMASTVALLGLICLYTLIGNHGYFFILFRLISDFTIKTFGKKSTIVAG